MVMWDGGIYMFVAHGAVVATFTILSLFAYFFSPYHSYILLISLEICFVLFVSFFGSDTDNTACACIYNEFKLDREVSAHFFNLNILLIFSLQDSKFILSWIVFEQ